MYIWTKSDTYSVGLFEFKRLMHYICNLRLVAYHYYSLNGVVLCVPM